jgi:putative intracellular protease/amidase
VVQDGLLLTGRGPDDLPAFCGKLVRLARTAPAR